MSGLQYIGDFRPAKFMNYTKQWRREGERERERLDGFWPKPSAIWWSIFSTFLNVLAFASWCACLQLAARRLAAGLLDWEQVLVLVEPAPGSFQAVPTVLPRRRSSDPCWGGCWLPCWTTRVERKRGGQGGTRSSNHMILLHTFILNAFCGVYIYISLSHTLIQWFQCSTCETSPSKPFPSMSTAPVFHGAHPVLSAAGGGRWKSEWNWVEFGPVHEGSFAILDVGSCVGQSLVFST